MHRMGSPPPKNLILTWLLLAALHSGLIRSREYRFSSYSLLWKDGLAVSSHSSFAVGGGLS